MGEPRMERTAAPDLNAVLPDFQEIDKHTQSTSEDFLGTGKAEAEMGVTTAEHTARNHEQVPLDRTLDECRAR